MLLPAAEDLVGSQCERGSGDNSDAGICKLNVAQVLHGTEPIAPRAMAEAAKRVEANCSPVRTR
jgi:hypothetical protein